MQNVRRFDLHWINEDGLAARHAERDLFMSESLRWKEYRVRQEIYKEHLKRTEQLADRVDSEATAEELNRISVAFFEQIFGKRRQPISLASNT
ncbi:MAG: hypothetical protein JOZ08_00785 [Verrucomicrobia bacterium]|nr:hypothetical protein [Verrucomicrobiota bacterium]